MSQFHKRREKSRKTVTASTGFMLALLMIFPISLGAKTLTLQDALQIAFENSPSIRQAQNSLESAQASLDAEEASLKSQFRFDLTPFSLQKDRTFESYYQEWYTSESKGALANFNISQRLKWTDAVLNLTNEFGWSKSTSENITGTETDKKFTNNLSLGLSQPLFTYNRTKHELKSLELDYESNKINYQLKRLQLEYQVTSAFYNVYQQRMGLDISKEEYKNAQESYEIIKNKVDAGISAKEELYQAEINQASSMAAVESDQVSYADGLDNLKIILGLSLHDSIDIAADVSKFVVDVDLDKAVESGLNSRMELRQAEISIENAELDLVTVGAEEEFKGSLDLEYGFVGEDARLADIYNSPTERQRISVEFHIPIWDWGQKKSKLRASELGLENEKIAYNDESKQVELEIRQTYRSLQNQLSQIDIAEKSVENARLTYEINLERYKNGDISSKDIGEFQTQLSREQLKHIAALISYRKDLLDLKIKSLWDFENDKPVLNID